MSTLLAILPSSICISSSIILQLVALGKCDYSLCFYYIGVTVGVGAYETVLERQSLSIILW